MEWPEMRYTNPNPMPHVIAEIEARIGEPIPEVYKKFLLEVNGGPPVKDYFAFYRNGVVELADVKVLYHISDPAQARFGDLHYIPKKLDVFDGRILEKTILIGNDSFGNQILLECELKNPGYGAIYFWDHDLEIQAGEVGEWINIFFVAPSFERFLQLLHVDEDEDDDNLF